MSKSNERTTNDEKKQNQNQNERTNSHTKYQMHVKRGGANAIFYIQNINTERNDL